MVFDDAGRLLTQRVPALVDPDGIRIVNVPAIRRPFDALHSGRIDVANQQAGLQAANRIGCARTLIHPQIEILDDDRACGKGPVIVLHIANLRRTR